MIQAIRATSPAAAYYPAAHAPSGYAPAQVRPAHFSTDRLSLTGIAGLTSAVYGAAQTVPAVSSAIGSSTSFGSVGNAIDRFGKGFAAARSGLGATVGVGTAIGAAFSLLTNGFGVATGRQSLGSAVGNVARDTVSAALSTVGSVLIGGAATAALGAVGVVGLPLTIAGLGISVVSGLAIDAAFRRSGLAQGLSGSLAAAID